MPRVGHDRDKRRPECYQDEYRNPLNLRPCYETAQERSRVEEDYHQREEEQDGAAGDGIVLIHPCRGGEAIGVRSLSFLCGRYWG